MNVEEISWQAVTSAPYDYNELRNKIMNQFRLNLNSIHGPSHWNRVERIGVKLCEKSGADIVVVRFFSLFHDSCRTNDSHDPQHGSRGAQLAEAMRGDWFDLSDERFEKLKYACSLHTHGGLSTDPTVGTCWDSDRLDLGRCGLIPDPKMLSTPVARQRETIAWALDLLRGNSP